MKGFYILVDSSGWVQPQLKPNGNLLPVEVKERRSVEPWLLLFNIFFVLILAAILA